MPRPSCEGFTTATGGFCVGVVDLESASHEAVYVIDFDAIKQVTGCIWNENSESIDVDFLAGLVRIVYNL